MFMRILSAPRSVFLSRIPLQRLAMFVKSLVMVFLPVGSRPPKNQTLRRSKQNAKVQVCKRVQQSAKQPKEGKVMIFCCQVNKVGCGRNAVVVGWVVARWW